MDWVSLMTGVVGTALAFALFSQTVEEEQETTEESGITVNTSNGRLVEISCQTCRKLKRHREIEDYLFECTKCKRRIDLRKAS